LDSKSEITRKIAGEIVLADAPGKSMRKWREIFGIKQNSLAQKLGISASVISDYESGRRKSPGIGFVRRFINALIQEDIKGRGGLTKMLSPTKKSEAILDLREFLTPLPIKKFIKAVDGRVIVRGNMKGSAIWGYTVIDSIKAILELSETDFMDLYGANTERALVFTKVHTGRSPMIAIKVTSPKPSLVILHGLKAGNVDKLAAGIAKNEDIPLVVSNIDSEEELTNKLRKLA